MVGEYYALKDELRNKKEKLDNQVSFWSKIELKKYLKNYRD